MTLNFVSIKRYMRKILLATILLSITPLSVIFGLIVFLTLYSQNSHPSNGRTAAYAALPSTQQNSISATITENDGKNAEKIRQFLARHGSPLEPYAVDIVDAADQYGLDRRLIVSIAMQESGLCKIIPDGSNNCWGFD